MKLISKPSEGEYIPYAIAYISLVPDDGAVLQYAADNLENVKSLIRAATEEELLYRYAPGKWNIKEVLVHIIDTERIFAYRALRIARNDKTPLTGFEQDDYVPASNAGERDIESIMEEYAAVRMATLTLFRSLDMADYLKTGVANNHPVSVRALAYQIAGHEQHHFNIIKERYLADKIVAV